MLKKLDFLNMKGTMNDLQLRPQCGRNQPILR